MIAAASPKHQPFAAQAKVTELLGHNSTKLIFIARMIENMFFKRLHTKHIFL